MQLAPNPDARISLIFTTNNEAFRISSGGESGDKVTCAESWSGQKSWSPSRVKKIGYSKKKKIFDHKASMKWTCQNLNGETKHGIGFITTEKLKKIKNVVVSNTFIKVK